MSEKIERSCSKCRYDAFSGCRFPEPQDGTEPPFMIAAAMPNDSEGGKNCIQYSAARQPKEPTP